jgi:hypothetical protein
MSALLDQHVAHVYRRVIEEALIEGTAAHWERRADDFATVGTPACDEVTLACRRHAWLVRDIGLDPEAQAELDEILRRRRDRVGPNDQSQAGAV